MAGKRVDDDVDVGGGSWGDVGADCCLPPPTEFVVRESGSGGGGGGGGKSDLFDLFSLAVVVVDVPFTNACKARSG